MSNGVPGQALHVNDVDLAWSEQGGRPAGTPSLVLVHGFTGSSHDFALVAGDLAADRRVVMVDHRGHGRSTKTRTLGGYTVAQLATDLTVFLEAVADGPVDLLGHSMGGRVVMELTVRRPDLVHSLVLMDTSAWSFLPPGDDIGELVRAWIEGFDPAQGLPVKLEAGSPEEALIEARTPVAWQQEKAVLQSGTDPWAVKGLGLALFAESEGEAPLRPQLPSIVCPTTVLAGEHDHPMVDQAPELAAEVADGRCTVIEGAYHSPQLTHRQEWLAAVQAHLAWAGAGTGATDR